MNTSQLQSIIDAAWDGRDSLSSDTVGEVREAVEFAIELLDSGKQRVAERQGMGQWTVNQWLKKAVLLSFRLNDMSTIDGGPGGSVWLLKWRNGRRTKSKCDIACANIKSRFRTFVLSGRSMKPR